MLPRALWPFLLILLCRLGVSSCPVDYHYDDSNNCIKMYQTPMNRFQALKTCQQEDAVLFNVPNAFANTALQMLGAQLGASLWIGATCASYSNSSCFDDEGTPNPFSNFYKGVANDIGACVLMASMSGKWYSGDCVHTTAPFVCKYTGNQNALSCDKGSWLFNGNCYKAQAPDYPANAEELCNNYNGHMTSIHSIGEDHFVFDVALNSFDGLEEYVRTGLVYDGGNGHWTDGSPVDYTNFELFLGNKPCADIALTRNVIHAGNWTSATCHVLVPTICKTPAIRPNTALPTQPALLCNTGQSLHTNTTLYSPNYPNAYVMEECTNIILSQGNPIYIQFTELYLNEDSYIKIYNDLDSSSPSATITYQTSPSNVYYSGSGIMKITFMGNNPARGNFRWRAVTSNVQITPSLPPFDHLTTESPIPTPGVPQLNCLFILDWDYLGDPNADSNAEDSYYDQNDFMNKVAAELFADPTVVFGAQLGIFGYPLSSSNVIFGSFDYNNNDFAADSNIDMGFDDMDICQGISAVNGYRFPAGSENTCLVFFSGQKANCNGPDGHQFKSTIGATLGGVDFSSTIPFDVPISDGFTDTDVNNLVNAIKTKTLSGGKATTPSLPSKSCSQSLPAFGQFSTNGIGSSSSCTITLTASPGHTAVANFHDFFVGPNDRVTFYNGTVSQNSVIGRYSGAQPGLSVEAPGSVMNIVISGIEHGYRGIFGTFYSN